MVWFPVLSSVAISCFELDVVGKDPRVSRSECVYLFCICFHLSHDPNPFFQSFLYVSPKCVPFLSDNATPIMSVGEVSLRVFLSDLISSSHSGLKWR